jgi:hypothetical protein
MKPADENSHWLKCNHGTTGSKEVYLKFQIAKKWYF